MSVLSEKHFHDEAAAYAWVEARIWPEGPVCPHCGGFDRIGKMGGKSTRIGAYKCYQCRKNFTVKVGTVFEASHVPMTLWLQAMCLLTSSKKGISSNQLHRTLGVTLKTAWFLSHRIREAMRVVGIEPLGGPNEPIEADETYIGGKAKNRAYREPAPKSPVFSLIERGGRVASFHVANVTATTLKPIIAKHAHSGSTLMTDEAPLYDGIGKSFAAHGTVNHSIKEYVRLDGYVHTNTAEGFFSVLKRGINGIYQHVSEAHLHRYLAEFDFRHNNRSKLGIEDGKRFSLAVQGAVGKRLTYRTTVS